MHKLYLYSAQIFEACTTAGFLKQTPRQHSSQETYCSHTWCTSVQPNVYVMWQYWLQVPNLFAKDEVMTIIEAVTPKAQRAGKGITPPEVYAYFVEQCRANLHMVLAMSPVGDAFR